MTLTAGAVDDLVEVCRWLPCDAGAQLRAIEGATVMLLLHAGRVGEEAAAIGDLLAELPEGFRAEVDGGWPLGRAVHDRHGQRWSPGLQAVDQLVCLGIAAGRARWTLPRFIWPALPGGMPFVTVQLGNGLP